MKVGPSIGDIFPATLMAFAILAAPRFRNIIGEGQHVAVAMYDSMVYLMYREIAIYECTGEVPGPSGIGVPLIAPYGAFEAKDGLVIITVASQTIWERFCRAIGGGLSKSSKVQTLEDRYRNFESLLKPIIEEWTRARERETKSWRRSAARRARSFHKHGR